MANKTPKTDAEWRAKLTAEQYYVTRQKALSRVFRRVCGHRNPASITACAAASRCSAPRRISLWHGLAELLAATG